MDDVLILIVGLVIGYIVLPPFIKWLEDDE